LIFKQKLPILFFRLIWTLLRKKISHWLLLIVPG
jgi:hypothetical protein